MASFTLESLVALLEGGGYTVVDSGADNRPELAELRKQELDITLPDPLFFAVVEGEGDLLKFSTELMEFVWSKFTRGQMEFYGFTVDDGNVRVVVTEKPAVSQKHGLSQKG